MITGTVSIVLLMVQSRRGPRTFEFVVIGLVAIIAIGFTFGVFIAPPDAGAVVAGLVPRFEGTGSVLLAASILGATIMPHAIYAHSALARDRFAPIAAGRPERVPVDVRTETRRRTERPRDRAPHDHADQTSRPLEEQRGISTAAPAARHQVGRQHRDAHRRHREPLHPAARRREPRRRRGHRHTRGRVRGAQRGIGPVVATLFAVGLLASGLASTSVGAYAGAEIMHGLLHVRIPLIARRLVTLIPALVILGIGVDPTLALVLSQVVLSFGIPFALIPLVVLTAQQRTLGEFRNRVLTTAAGVAASVFLITLNGVLLWLVLTGA